MRTLFLAALIAGSTTLAACDMTGASTDEAADDISEADAAAGDDLDVVIATGRQINLPTRLVKTTVATKLFTTATGTTGTSLAVGSVLELDTTTWVATGTAYGDEHYSDSKNSRYAVLTSDFQLGWVPASALAMNGFAKTDGNDTMGFPLPITASSESGSAMDHLPAAADKDYWSASVGRTVKMRSPSGKNYALRLLQLNADKSLNRIISTSTSTTVDSVTITGPNQVVQVISPAGTYGIGALQQYKIWAI